MFAPVVESTGQTDEHGNVVQIARENVLGYAVEQEKGDAEEYTRLGLTTAEAPTLFVVFDTYGRSIDPGARAWWSGAWWQVVSVQPYRPDGTVLFADVILQRGSRRGRND